MILRTCSLILALALGASLPVSASGNDPARPDPLAGPSVAPTDAPAAGTTLIRRDFEGRLAPLDVRPEEAALALLDLTPQEDEATRDVLDRRAALMDDIVSKNIDLLLRAQEVKSGAGDKRRLMRDMLTTFAPLSEDGTLEQQLAKVLPADKAERLRSITAEYWHALIEDRATASSTPGEDAMMQDQPPKRKGLRERLAPYKVPRELEFLPELPKSTVMKILRRELRERELAQRKSAN